MTERITCSLCTVEATAADMTNHFNKKHDVTKRNDAQYEKTSIQVDNKEFDVLYNQTQDLYRCPVCISGGNKESMTKHFIKFHISTAEERRYERDIEKSEIVANTVYCDICWIHFPEGEDSFNYKKHFESNYHLRLLKYEEGSGCDICRAVPELDKHVISNFHIQRSSYTKNEGCNTCKIPFKQRKSLEFHFQTEAHKKARNYVLGTGCDVCRVCFPKHEETNAHYNKVNSRDFIYRRYIAPRCKAKSARK